MAEINEIREAAARKIVAHIAQMQAPPQRIYLLGMPACGKSNVGKKLRAALPQFDRIDLDVAIETYAGIDIPTLFERHGEDHFRHLEAEQLREIEGENRIISVGGGTPCYFDNMAYMNQRGLTVYINVSLSLLVERMARKPEKRPMTAGKTTEEIEQLVNELHEKRAPFYRQASLILDL